MYLHDSDKGCVEIVGLRLFGVKDFDRIGATRNGEDRATIEILRELLGIESS
jgi:hypothetical protein